jgi:nucleotide-binding universal stress UspA family protein
VRARPGRRRDRGRVVRRAPCPVAVAPRGLASRDEVLRRVGVGYDGTPEAKQALELARAISEASDAIVELVCVVPPPVPLGPWRSRSQHQRLRAHRVREGRGARGRRTRDLDDLANAHVVEGRPDIELATRSSDLDLLVVGSRGYGPLKRLLLGSTSSKLVRSAACPVIVLPRAAHEVGHQTPDAVRREARLAGSGAGRVRNFTDATRDQARMPVPCSTGALKRARVPQARWRRAGTRPRIRGPTRFGGSQARSRGGTSFTPCAGCSTAIRSRPADRQAAGRRAPGRPAWRLARAETLPSTAAARDRPRACRCRARAPAL